jgi:hypothetical protein
MPPPLSKKGLSLAILKINLVIAICQYIQPEWIFPLLGEYQCISADRQAGPFESGINQSLFCIYKEGKAYEKR